VGDEQQVLQAFDQTLAALGRIDAFFANSGVSGFGSSLLDLTYEEYRRVMRVNVDGCFLCFREAARHMIGRGGGGVLVATASTAALEGAARNSHYGASKGAVTSFVRALAVELARHQIRVNSLIPGWIETDMTAAKFAEPRFSANVLPRVPARRWGRADDFAGIAVYLMSDASSYMTGEALVLDGGYTVF
jgi:NAD(P)-dependent dehydrogenase (short-subunit alcohol dehydrogenase family)